MLIWFKDSETGNLLIKHYDDCQRNFVMDQRVLDGNTIELIGITDGDASTLEALKYMSAQYDCRFIDGYVEENPFLLDVLHRHGIFAGGVE